MAARLGGDEFAVILRIRTARIGEEIARTIVAAVGDLGFEHDGETRRIGASIGVSAIGPRGAAVDEIMARADHACYEAKAAGRGQVVGAGPRATPGTSELARAS